MPRNGGLERWRGEVTERLTDVARRIDDLGNRFEKALQQHADEDVAEFDDLGGRVAKIEEKHATLAGKVAIVSVLVGAAGAALIEVAIKALAN
jgi:hypothetical protein